MEFVICQSSGSCVFASFLGGMCRFTLGFSVWEDCWAWIGAGAGSCAATPVFNGHGQSGSLVCAFRLIESPSDDLDAKSRMATYRWIQRATALWNVQSFLGIKALYECD